MHSQLSSGGSGRVRIDEHCDIGLCNRASIKHDIVVLEICVHNLTVVHMCKTLQSVENNSLGQW